VPLLLARGISSGGVLLLLLRFSVRSRYGGGTPTERHALTTDRFQPQPYPLFAVPLKKADAPARFELAAIDPVQLVIGWVTVNDGITLPALSNGVPVGTPWSGPVLLEETRKRAESVAEEIEKAGRSTVRTARLEALIERVDAQLQALEIRAVQFLERLDKKNVDNG
jgi:hypothetical protein